METWFTTFWPEVFLLARPAPVSPAREVLAKGQDEVPDAPESPRLARSMSPK